MIKFNLKNEIKVIQTVAINVIKKNSLFFFYKMSKLNYNFKSFSFNEIFTLL